jgi:Secretion system C-terminal sorting domain
LKNKSKFDSLKRLLSILSFVFLIAINSNGQEARNVNPDGPGKVLKIYPNPATSYITIDLQKDYQKGMIITVYSFLGKKMYENQNVTERTTLTLTDYNRGIYVYHIADQTGKVIFTGKFQVTR